MAASRRRDASPATGTAKSKAKGKVAVKAKTKATVKSNAKASAKAPAKGSAKAPAKGSAKGSSKGAPVPAPLAPRFFRYDLPRQGDGVRHWLLKSEPESFSFQDLLAAKEQTACWDGVRNFQARNFMRDHMRVGDLVLIYHSNAEPPAVAGVARVTREAYPDPSAFDRADDHFDPKSDPAAPTWMMVDVQAVQALRPVSLATLRDTPGLESMELLQRGSRLSITPLTPQEWRIVVRLGEAEMP